ncbi:MAG: endonuclease V [Candidatus Thorarchaeota archaeon]
MLLHELLRDDYSLAQAKSLQEKYKQIIHSNQEPNQVKNIKDVKTIVGVDISYYRRGNTEYGIGCAVLWDIEEETIENEAFYRNTINFPYKTGFLGFRECRILAKSILKLPTSPDLIMCDGHGIIHPRKFGEAVQLGFSLNIPSIGVAKKPYIGYSKWKKLTRFKGNTTPILANSPNSKKKDGDNELLGYAVCLNDGSKPVFISSGYITTIDAAIEICLATSKGHRQPEPLFMADQLSKKRVKRDLPKLKQEYDFKVT